MRLSEDDFQALWFNASKKEGYVYAECSEGRTILLSLRMPRFTDQRCQIVIDALRGALHMQHHVCHVTLDTRLPSFLECVEKIGEIGDEARKRAWYTLRVHAPGHPRNMWGNRIVCLFVHECVCVYLHVCICVRVFVYMCVYLYLSVCKSLCVCVCTCKYQTECLCVCTCMCVCVCVYILYLNVYV